jgi:hypothetical protein
MVMKSMFQCIFDSPVEKTQACTKVAGKTVVKTINIPVPTATQTGKLCRTIRLVVVNSPIPIPVRPTRIPPTADHVTPKRP